MNAATIPNPRRSPEVTITHKLLVSGREVIALDSIPHTKRFAEDRFRRLRHSQAVIKWENQTDGSIMLTWRLPVQPTADFFTSGYKIVEAGTDV